MERELIFIYNKINSFNSAINTAGATTFSVFSYIIKHQNFSININLGVMYIIQFQTSFSD